MKTADTMLFILTFGIVIGVAPGCTEVVRTCNNCYLSLPQADLDHCVINKSDNTPKSTCLGYLKNNGGLIAVTWNAVLGGQPNYCKQFNCYHIFTTSGMNTTTYTKSCNADCNSVTLTTNASTRVASSETPVNVTHVSEDVCVNMCIEMAYKGVNCVVSHNGSHCHLYVESICTGGSCSTQAAVDSWTVIAAKCDFAVCPMLTLENGSVNMSSRENGSTATFSCNTGYVTSELTTVTCQTDGTWSSVIPPCQAVSCGSPNALSNGNVSAPVTTYLANATYSCNLGYNLSGQNSTTCQADGTWSGTLPTCNPISCVTPSTPSNGSINVTLTTYLATATYSCNSGYNLSGQNSTTCQANETWSGTLPTCNPVSCGTPPIPSSCNVTASGTTYLEWVFYECHTGYLLTGEQNNSTCQANMTWSGLTPTCQPIDCGQPSAPNNGIAQAEITHYSHLALYDCEFGYRLEGQNTSVCLSNGSWSDSVPSCVVINCSYPTPPSNGSVNLTGTTYMARADYSCDTGYNLTGHNVRVCQLDDTWNGTDPRCDPVDCGNRTAPMNGSVNQSGTTYRETAVYVCEPGFVLVGQNSSVCLADGFWSTEVPLCDPVNCGNLTDPENGIVSVTETTYTSVASYQCNFGYRLDGENITECLSNSSWSYAKPNCTMIGCGPLNNPENGFVFMPDGTDVGAKATYSCKPGFKLSHANGRNCDKKQWTGKAPTCAKRKYQKIYIKPCLCYPNKTFQDMTMEEILEKLENDTKIDPKKTAVARSKLESTYDRRPSSAIIGAVGVTVLALVFGLIVCVDLFNAYNHFKERQNKIMTDNHI